MPRCIGIDPHQMDKRSPKVLAPTGVESPASYATAMLWTSAYAMPVMVFTAPQKKFLKCACAASPCVAKENTSL